MDTNKTGADAAATTDMAEDGKSDGQNEQLPATDEVMDEESALGNGVVNRYIHPRENERYDMLIFFSNTRHRVLDYLQSRARRLGGVKWNLCVQVEMQRDDVNEVAVTSPYFRSRTYVLLSADDVNEHDLNEAMQKMYASLEKFMRDGSGWYLKKVVKLEIHTVIYKPLGGSTYLPLPKSLALGQSILNIQNQDDKCFLYCLVASVHPAITEPELPEHYYPYVGEVNMSGITYPVTLQQMNKVENQNPCISINVFAYEDKTIVPLRITEKLQRAHHANLLWLTCEGKSHYCLIKNLNRFLSQMNRNKNQMYFCPYCLHGFCKETSLQEHKMYCSRHGAQKIELPIRNKNDLLQFTDYEKTLKVPFVIYADTETLIQKVHTCQPNPDRSASTPSTKLEVCGFGYKVVCENEQYTKPTVIYRGKDAGKKLIEGLLREEEEIRSILSNIEPMNITEQHQSLIEKAIKCCLCKKVFTKYDKTYGRIVRHHNHLTGKIIGAACNGCNLKCRQATFIPVLFHNLKHFDGHIIWQNAGHFKHRRLKCIAQNTEHYVSFSIGHLRFIDSFQFLPSSLETLIDNLTQDGLQAFAHLRSETNGSEEAQLLLRKGVYPYEYMDSFEKFEESELPPKEKFYSSIKKEHVSDEDYEHAKTVFSTFAMSSLGEYHDLYLKSDVVLLADVFEAFRNLCLKQYELDPCHFYTSPGLSWSACLKMTKVQLELLTDIDKILMVESGIRGGISQISNRYEKANNPYLEDYDPSKASTYLLDLDANNLYGWAMVHKLPVRDFDFMDKRDVESFDIMSVPENGDTGYIIEASIRYPQHLHNSHNSLPLAPVKRAITDNELSPYAQKLLRKLYGLSEDDRLPKRGKVEKLLTTLEDKDHYPVYQTPSKKAKSIIIERTATKTRKNVTALNN
ncbi:MAG: DNA polymerase, partial [Candidatus Thiodiazotropha taylori]|nr:DNA polymerase [Candidatus Thiodiazotropha taylori]